MSTATPEISPEQQSVKSTFVVHQHHHFGWTTNVREASTPEEAMRSDILRYHPWLSEFSYDLTFPESRYKVDYTGEPRPVFGGYQYAGYWFGDKIRIGQPDDCGKCGGTGINHYNPFCQCWNCGEREALGKSSGKISAKDQDQ